MLNQPRMKFALSMSHLVFQPLYLTTVVDKIKSVPEVYSVKRTNINCHSSY